jgi:tetratricopeptide (TPR) repeat protein
MIGRQMKTALSHRGTTRVLFLIYAASFCACAEVRPLKEAPPPDPAVVNGAVDTKYSREWWKAQNEKFEQALTEKNTELIVSISRDAAIGWKYSAPRADIILEKAITYLQRKPSEHQDDLIMLINARAEAIQYVRAGDEATREGIAAEVFCAPYQRALVYKRSGQYLTSIQELEQFYKNGKAERERFRNMPYSIAAPCPLEEKDLLVELIEERLVVAFADDTAPDAAQRHLQDVIRLISELTDYVDAKDIFSWGDRKLIAHFVGNPVWSISSLRLCLAREMHATPSDYIKLTGEELKKLTGPDPFSYYESLLGQKYLEAAGVSEDVVWDFLQMHQDFLAGWPAGKGGSEYQHCALDRLQFAIKHKNIPNAEAVVEELSGVSFVNQDLLDEFNRRQLDVQYMLKPSPPQLPLGALLDGVVKGIQADAASSMPDEHPTTRQKIFTIIRHSPVSLALLGITLACFVTLIAMRIRRAVSGKS